MSIISAAVPTATPPASVAFWMCTWAGRAGRAGRQASRTQSSAENQLCHGDSSFLSEPQFLHPRNGYNDPYAACLTESLAGPGDVCPPDIGGRSCTPPQIPTASPAPPPPAHHVQLALLVQGAGQRHRGQHAGRQRAVGVNGCSVLGVSVIGHSRVEAGPVHPEEEGAWPDQMGPGAGEEALDGWAMPSCLPSLSLYSCWGLFLKVPPPASLTISHPLTFLSAPGSLTRPMIELPAPHLLPHHHQGEVFLSREGEVISSMTL